MKSDSYFTDDELEAQNYLKERKPRLSSWLKRTRTYSNVPEVVEQIEISSEESDDNTTQVYLGAFGTVQFDYEIHFFISE